MSPRSFLPTRLLLVLGVLALLSGLVLPAVAQEEFGLTVDPTVGLAETDTVSVTLAGTPSGEGLYVRQCIAPVGEERPTVCDGTGSWATLPAGLPGTPDGSLQPSQGTFDFPVAQAFGDVDCTVVQCGIFTRRDHNDPGDTSLDRWVPITFAAGVPGGARAVERVQGSDRFTTAAMASGSFEAPMVAFVANGTGFADALAGGPAAVINGAPLLLVEADTVPPATSDALTALAPDLLVLLGGEGAISAAVEQELAAIAPTSRRSGVDRWATAAAVSAAAWPDGATDVLVASGIDHPDALSGGAGAGMLGSPLLLVATDTVPEETRAELERLSPSRITILGGQSSVSAAVQQELNGIAPTTRIAGTSRFDTAATVATTLWSSGTRRAVVVNGEGFADALSAAPLAGLFGGPVLLVTRDTAPQETLDALDQLGVTTVTVLGGPGVVSDAVLAALVGGGASQ